MKLFVWMYKDAKRVDQSLYREFVKKIDFFKSLRCKDPALARKLNALRTSVPSKKLLKDDYFLRYPCY